MFERYAASLADHSLLAVGVAGLAVALCRPGVRDAIARLPAMTGPALVAVAALAGVAWGFELAWLGDDAFISFRYADNLVHGHGLVFNPGERVEGYTNFLWTLLMAGFIRLGADPGQASIVVSLASFGALVALAARIRRLAFPESDAGVLPIAVLLLAAQYTMASYATSGLETMFAAFLVALALERALARAALSAGAAGIAATLCHPDHGLLYAALGLALLLDPSRRRGLVRYAIPFFAVYVPYFVWRWSWYGDVFPNAYYAKSADLTYFGQGGLYVASFAIGSGLFAALPLLAYSGVRLRENLLTRYLAIAVPVFLVYVAKIGGDFMYGRLFVALIAPVLVLGELGVRCLLAERRTGWASAGLTSLALCAVPTTLLASGEKYWHISDERTFYPLISFAPLDVESRYFRSARILREHFVERGVAPRVALQCVGTVGYYTGLPIVDRLGITDRTVAHTPLAKRGRPGHEKQAPLAYLVDRGVELADAPLFPDPYAEVTRLSLGRFDYWLAHYDPELMAPLRDRADVSFADFDADLARRKDALRRLRRSDAAACDVWFVERFYATARGNDREAGRAATRALLAAGSPRSASISPEVLDAFDYERTHRLVPVDPAIFPTRWPISTQGPGQGGFATSRRRSAVFSIEGDVLELWVAGGRGHGDLSVSLWIDGARVLTTTGCGSELPGRRLWNVAAFRGKTAALEILDEGLAPRRYIALERLGQWVPKAETKGEGGVRLRSL